MKDLRPFAGFKNLVMVACHAGAYSRAVSAQCCRVQPNVHTPGLMLTVCFTAAVYVGSDYGKPLDFASWFLLDYQKVML